MYWCYHRFTQIPERYCDFLMNYWHIVLKGLHIDHNGKVTHINGDLKALLDHIFHCYIFFLSKLKINVNLASGYHPQYNRQVEWLNQEEFSGLIVVVHKVKSIFSFLGWVWSELQCQHDHGINHFQMYSRLPACLVWVSQHQSENMGQSSCILTKRCSKIYHPNE